MKESTHRNIYIVMENGKATAVTTSRKAARKILQKKREECNTLSQQYPNVSTTISYQPDKLIMSFSDSAYSCSIIRFDNDDLNEHLDQTTVQRFIAASNK